MTDSEILGRSPPHDLAAEKGVIGSIILLPAMFDEVIEVIGPEDFYNDANKVIYERLLELHAAGKPIDVTLLATALKATGDWERAGGTAYMWEVGNSVPHASSATYYAEIIQTASKRRGIINAATETLQDAYDLQIDPDELCGRVARQIDNIAAGRRAADLVTAETAVDDALKKAHERYANNVSSGLPTGLHDYDRRLGGLHNSELVVLAARPGMGKTALALQIALHNAVDGEVVLYWSCEMSSTELMTRAVCAKAKVSSRTIRGGTLTATDLSALDVAGDSLRQAELHIDDRPGLKVCDIRLAARRVKRQKSLALVVVDYLQMLAVDDRRAARHTAVGQMSGDLKTLSRELDVPVLCLAQLNRQSEQNKDHRPTLSSLRESGAIEQDADVVAFIHRAEVYEPRDEMLHGQAELLVQKNRNGPTGNFKLTWNASATTFGTAALSTQQEYDFGECGDGTSSNADDW